jgi:lysyl endopeptidase
MLAIGVPARRLELATPAASEVATMKARNLDAEGRRKRVSGKALAVGFGREIPAAARAIPLSALTWIADGDGGRSARIEIHSPNATALRVAMQLPATDPGLTVQFAAGGDNARVFGAVPANAVARDTQRFGQFWSPVLEGEVATIEFHAGPDVVLDGLVLTLPRVSHQVASNSELRALSAKTVDAIGQAQSCNIDVACVTPSAALSNAAKAVAQLLFIGDSEGNQFQCTGTLLNDLPSSNTPYLFTAAHCMTSANAAHTLNTLWFFDAVACKNNAIPPYVQLTGGATLLGRSQDHDWALVRLDELPPVGVMFSAWSADAVPLNAITTTLHHPMGDLKKWSKGYAGKAIFVADSVVHGNFNEVPYTSGITEGGSSGSALLTFRDSGGYYEVRGGISEGSLVSCPVASGDAFDDYSRVEDMLPLMREYLTPGALNPTGQAVAVEFYNKTLDHYFLSANPEDIRDLDTGVFTGWERTGLRFLAYISQLPGTNPVCRFYRKPAYGDSHFYSASPAECAATAANFPDWTYESPAVFYIRLPDAKGACPAGTQPLWRFFNKVTINHRYTAEIIVRDRMRAEPSVWIPEGYGTDQTIMCAASR